MVLWPNYKWLATKLGTMESMRHTGMGCYKITPNGNKQKNSGLGGEIKFLAEPGR